MHKFSTILAASCLIFSLAGPANSQDADTVLATVNGTPITLGHMIVLQERLPQRFRDLPDDVLFRGALDQLIKQTALSQEIEKGSNKALELGLENEIRAFLAGEMLARIRGAPITESELRVVYAERFTKQEFNASHILVPTETEAVALRAMIEDGSDFAELAKEHSTDHSAPGGGALGWFGLGQMVPAFESTLIALNDGEVSDPVETQFGWHIVKRNESRVQSAAAFETVKVRLEADLREKAVSSFLTRVTGSAEVVRELLSEFDPALIRKTDLLEK